MRITTSQVPESGTRKPGVLDVFAREAVIGLLKNISKGCLTLEDQGQVYYFGENREHASICAHITVRHVSAYRVVLGNGSVGAGEAYMAGLWESPDLLQVIRLMVLNLSMLETMDSGRSWWKRGIGRLIHYCKKNTRTGSRRNIAAHYDLSNDFFKLFLDPSMAYSSAIYRDEYQDLEQASEAKFEHICRRLQLKPEDHLLEIGTGWGGLAIYAARNFGCRVTTTTVSHQQYLYASDWIARENLGDKITLLEKDYRDLHGSYDKLVSVEMIEAVGSQYYGEFFRQCCSLLKQDGLMLLQSITISDHRYADSLGRVDFIKRYIFPGGQLPCNSVIASQVATQTDMQLIGLEDITRDYALTLNAWRKRFWRNIEEIRARHLDESFIRMWHYYLCFCEGGFRERVIHTAQFLLARPGFKETPRIS